MNKDSNLEHKRHTLAHLLACAVRTLYPNAKNAIGPAIENGFYQDFDLVETISDKDLLNIEKEMKKILKTWKSFEKKDVSEKEALKEFDWNEYKCELIKDFSKDGKQLTFYTSGGFVDLCKGGHSENPADEIKQDSFKLERVAGAYWKGDEKNKMLTRIYGLAFDTKEELLIYEKNIEEAKKRDHKKLGKELDLFTFSDLVGAGLPLWTPKGTLLRNLLDDFVWHLRAKHGYERVDIPHITKKDLYETSGHWQKFGNELFRVKTREGHEFVMKPMNCPHHTQIYARKQWSYRELPQRYASTTKVYRDEQSGELSGLSRVRSITQDDAHVFCRQNQVKDEMSKIWQIIETFYGAFGFKLEPRLSLHDPKNMNNYLGDEATWLTTEKELRDLVKDKGQTAIEAIGEAAFYGPKIDFMGSDSMGRQWQVATIQLDMNMPESFDLICMNEKSEKERIVMIHAAIMGSIERFLSVIIEKYAGAFPLWLSPVQVKIIPVLESHNEYATEVLMYLRKENLRVEIDLDDANLGKKVRKAKVEKIPYFIIIGDKEIADKKITLESRDKGKIGEFDLEALTKLLREEIEKKS